MVIDDANFGPREGVKDRPVEFNEGLIFPKGGGARGVQPEPSGDLGQEVVAVFIGEIARTDFRFHIPTAERGCGKADPPDLQPHVGDNGEGDPPKMKRVEARGVGMPDGNLQGRMFGRWKDPGFFARQGDDDGEEIERSAFFGRFPS